jgi:serine/threonine protein phosphatase 1
MHRKLVIGDIHGGLRALHQIFERANVTKEDTLIFLGDYVDGWSESPQTLDFLIALAEKQNCIFIRGNHDELLLEWLEKSTDNREWYKHGGEATVLAYLKVDFETKQKHIQFLKNLQKHVHLHY